METCCIRDFPSIYVCIACENCRLLIVLKDEVELKEKEIKES